jgi:hypothetical protein
LKGINVRENTFKFKITIQPPNNDRLPGWLIVTGIILRDVSFSGSLDHQGEDGVGPGTDRIHRSRSCDALKTENNFIELTSTTEMMRYVIVCIYF